MTTTTTSASLAAAAEAYAPAQHAEPAVHDFRRFSGKSPRGFKFSNKRKLDEYEEQAVEESAGMMMDDNAADADNDSKQKIVTPTLVFSTPRALHLPLANRLLQFAPRLTKGHLSLSSPKNNRTTSTKVHARRF